MSSGFKDKLYWREDSRPGHRGKFHCFKKASWERSFVPLCDAPVSIGFGSLGGQGIARPAVHERCGACDGLEMERRGWPESGPATVSQEDAE